jgi:hypothetical protein
MASTQEAPDHAASATANMLLHIPNANRLLLTIDNVDQKRVKDLVEQAKVSCVCLQERLKYS